MSTLVRFQLKLRFQFSILLSTPSSSCACLRPKVLNACHKVSTPVRHSCQCFSSVNVKMDVTDTAMLAGISAAFLVLKRVRKRREKYQRSIWLKDYLRTRNFGIMRDLDDNVLFKNFTRMSRTNFYMLLQMVKPKIAKENTRFREAIPAEVKLAITLRYLATGDSFTSLMYLFKVSKQFISSMLPGVLSQSVHTS